MLQKFRNYLLNSLIILFFSLLPSVVSRSSGIPALSNMEFFSSSRFACLMEGHAVYFDYKYRMLSGLIVIHITNGR